MMINMFKQLAEVSFITHEDMPGLITRPIDSIAKMAVEETEESFKPGMYRCSRCKVDHYIPAASEYSCWNCESADDLKLLYKTIVS